MYERLDTCVVLILLLQYTTGYEIDDTAVVMMCRNYFEEKAGGNA